VRPHSGQCICVSPKALWDQVCRYGVNDCDTRVLKHVSLTGACDVQVPYLKAYLIALEDKGCDINCTINDEAGSLTVGL